MLMPFIEEVVKSFQLPEEFIMLHNTLLSLDLLNPFSCVKSRPQMMQWEVFIRLSLKEEVLSLVKNQLLEPH